ncbi:hypothetical protein B0H14DRAFT_3892772, partial [Mycena olivaceomarginata]
MSILTLSSVEIDSVLAQHLFSFQYFPSHCTLPDLHMDLPHAPLSRTHTRLTVINDKHKVFGRLHHQNTLWHSQAAGARASGRCLLGSHPGINIYEYSAHRIINSSWLTPS